MATSAVTTKKRFITLTPARRPRSRRRQTGADLIKKIATVTYRKAKRYALVALAVIVYGELPIVTV